MSKYKRVAFISLLAIAVFGGNGLAYAKKADNSFRGKAIDVKHNQTFNERQKMQHSERKAAAKRLKAKFQAVREEEMAQAVKEHGKGHSHNKGQKGVGK
jgi:hypothetical protein